MESGLLTAGLVQVASIVVIGEARGEHVERTEEAAKKVASNYRLMLESNLGHSRVVGRNRAHPMFESEGTMLSSNKWDCRFLELAHVISQWSKDPSTRVGAVITNERRVDSLGFNGFPTCVDDLDERYENRETKYKMVVHAEANAIISARESLIGCTIYVSASPCAACAGKIIQAGIKRVISVVPTGNFGDRWTQELEVASTMFRESGVDLIQFQEGWRSCHQRLAPCPPLERLA